MNINQNFSIKWVRKKGGVYFAYLDTPLRYSCEGLYRAMEDGTIWCCYFVDGVFESSDQPTFLACSEREARARMEAIILCKSL